MTAIVPRSRRRPRRGVGFGLFAVQVGVVMLVALVAAGVAVVLQTAQVRQEAVDDVEVLADSVATLPIVIEGLQSDDPTAVIQPVTSALEQAADVEYIAVVDMAGVRVAHPRAELVGEPVSSDHSLVRAGQRFVGSEEGPMGVTLRAKVPVYSADGRIVGTVSVGTLQSSVEGEVARRVLQVSLPTLAAVLLGLVVSWRATAGLRRRLYGVEPDEMLAHVQARQALTDGVQDGFVGVGDDGRIALVNAGAQRLLRLPGGLVGERAADVLPDEVLDLLDEPGRRTTAELRTGGRTLVASRSAAVADGREVGTMLVLQDRSELESMLATLEHERARSDALRVEAHDFDNRMHVVAGLLGLGDLDDARAYLASLPRAERPGASSEFDAVESPLVAALLASRAAQADGAGIELALAEDRRVERGFACGPEEVTVLGNLVSNAIEHARTRIEVFVAGDEEGLEVVVDDDGPGVPEERAERIFERGETSKGDESWRHGIGLGVIREYVDERGGELSVTRADLGGARFQAFLPAARGGAEPAGASDGTVVGGGAGDDGAQAGEGTP